MTQAGEPDRIDDAAQAAADWVVRLSGDGVAEADWLAFTAWLDGAPSEHPDLRREAFDRAQGLWLELDHLRTPPPASFSVRRPAGRRAQRAVRGRLVWSAAAAALGVGVLGVGVLGAWLVVAPRSEPAPASAATHTYATAAGQRAMVRLADGTRIELDGGTSLTLARFGSTRREVVLERGEAVFDVVHDPARPFQVDLGSARVEVLGTRFDIVRDAGATRVSVARGAVRFDTAQGGARLPAGMSAELVGGRLQVSAVTPGDVDAWTRGRRLYWNQPLVRVVSDLDRGYAQPIRLDGAQAKAMRFTGVLVLRPRDEMVRRLTALLPLQAETASDGAVVLSSR